MSLLDDRGRTCQSTLIWHFESKPGNLRSLIYAFQWLSLSIVQIGVIALIMGPYLGLDKYETAFLSQRMFFFAGVITLLQLIAGHRLPVVDGPSSLWWVTFISLINVGLSMNRPLSMIRTDLMGALCVSGLLMFAIGASGLLGKIKRFLTPSFIGSALILLTLQISETFVTGILGITESNPSIDLLALASSVISIAVVIYVSYSRIPFLRSINLLIGLISGWGVYQLLTRRPFNFNMDIPLFNFPQMLHWGKPTFNPGMVTAGLMVVLMLIANNIASITAMARVTEVNMDEKRIGRSVALNGVGNILAGIGSSIGAVPLTASLGVVKLSGVASYKPVIMYSFLLISIGFLPGVSLFFSQIPRPVGYAVMMAAYTQILISGFHSIRKLSLTRKDSFVLGFTIIIGAGLMSLPVAALKSLPVLVRYIAGQGMFTGLLVCFFLEQVLLKGKEF